MKMVVSCAIAVRRAAGLQGCRAAGLQRSIGSVACACCSPPARSRLVELDLRTEAL